MTKEEKIAEEIANKRCHEIMCYGHCSFNSPKHHRCGEWHREYNCALAGLKADTNHSLVEQMTDLESKNAELARRNKEKQGDKRKCLVKTIK